MKQFNINEFFRDMIKIYCGANEGGRILEKIMEQDEPENQLIGLQEFVLYMKSDLKSNPSPEKMSNFREIYPYLKKLILKVKEEIQLNEETNKLKLENQKLREDNSNLIDE
jgi:hypothetical protein